MNREIFVCKGLKLMNYLVRKGFDCIKVKQDNQNSRMVVFCFEDTEDLRETLNTYFNSK